MTAGCGCASCVAQDQGSDGVTSMEASPPRQMRERAPTRAAAAPAPKFDLNYIIKTRRLTEVYSAIQATYPRLGANEVLVRAQKVVDDESRGVEDPERLELHRMAMDWSRDHPGADYRQALLAVSREYEARVAPRIMAARGVAPDRDFDPDPEGERLNERLNDAALRYLDEHPGAKFREALLAVSARGEPPNAEDAGLSRSWQRSDGRPRHAVLPNHDGRRRGVPGRTTRA